jgi:RIO kinase 1
MRIPNSLISLADQGIIDEVVRPLMSGKEAEVFLVRSGGQLRVAKVYKEAQNRSFKNRAEYTEGRKVRNTRDQRAINKRSRHGRDQDEAAWRSTEVDMIYRLRDAGVRVPTPHHFIDGVLIMELITDEVGDPAPRLAEVSLSAEEAVRVFDRLLAEAVRMLCAGVVHGDLSDFNVLMGADGPVIIDLPQAVDASSNQNARKLLLRDVDNLQRFLSRFAPNRQPRPYAQEMWELYSCSQLTPDTPLSGRFRSSSRRADTASVLELIGEADHDERRRREARGLSMRGAPPAPRRVEVLVAPSDPRARRSAQGPQGGGAANPRPNQPQGGGAASHRPAQNQGGGAASHRPAQNQGGGAASHRPAQSHGGGAESHRPAQNQGGGAPSHRPSQSHGGGAESHRPAQSHGGGAPSHRPVQQGGAPGPRPIHEGSAGSHRPAQKGGAPSPRPIHEGGAGSHRPAQNGGAPNPRPILHEGGAAPPRATPEGSGDATSDNSRRRRIVRSGRTSR